MVAVIEDVTMEHEERKPKRRKAQAMNAESIQVQDIPVSLIDPNPLNEQLRPGLLDVADLGASMAAHEYLREQYIKVYPSPADPERYIIRHGHRRFHAWKLTGAKTIPAVVVAAPEGTDLDELVGMAVDNVQQGINPLAQAKLMQRLVEERYMTIEKAGRALGIKSPQMAVVIYSSLKMPPTVQKALATRPDSAGHLSVSALQAMPRRAAPEVLEEVLEETLKAGGTVKAAKQATRRVREAGKAAPRQRVQLEPDENDPVVKANRGRSLIEEIARAYDGLMPASQARVDHVLKDIASLINQVV